MHSHIFTLDLKTGIRENSTLIQDEAVTQYTGLGIPVYATHLALSYNRNAPVQQLGCFVAKTSRIRERSRDPGCEPAQAVVENQS